MAKIYIGGLPQDITEEAFKLFLDEEKVIYESVLIKKGGYAFVDLSSIDQAKESIDKLNGKTFCNDVKSRQKVIFLHFFFTFQPPPTDPPPISFTLHLHCILLL